MWSYIFSKSTTNKQSSPSVLFIFIIFFILVVFLIFIILFISISAWRQMMSIPVFSRMPFWGVILVHFLLLFVMLFMTSFILWGQGHRMARAMRSLFPLSRFVYVFIIVFVRSVSTLFELSCRTMVFPFLWHWTVTST